MFGNVVNGVLGFRVDLRVRLEIMLTLYIKLFFTQSFPAGKVTPPLTFELSEGFGNSALAKQRGRSHAAGGGTQK